MPKTQLPARALIAALLALCTYACDESGSGHPDTTPKAATHGSAANASETAGASETQSNNSDPKQAAPAADAPPEPAVEAPMKLPRPPIERGPAVDQVLASLKDQDVGRLSGEVFGKDRIVRGIVRAHCGEGVVLQPIYEDDGKLWIVPAVRLDFVDLPTKRLEYHAGGFDIAMQFEQASRERVKGSLSIAYGEGREYLSLQVDAKPLVALLPHRLPGGGKDIPPYTACATNGYFRAVDANDQVVQGFARLTNTGGTGAPSVHIVFAETESMSLMVIPPEPGTELDGSAELTFRDHRKPGALPAALLGRVSRIPVLGPADEAVGDNLGRHEGSQILDGEAKVALRRDKKAWTLDLQATNVVVPETYAGSLAGWTLKELRVYGQLSDSTDMAPAIVDPPSWWQNADGVAPIVAPKEESPN